MTSPAAAQDKVLLEAERILTQAALLLRRDRHERALARKVRASFRRKAKAWPIADLAHAIYSRRAPLVEAEDADDNDYLEVVASLSPGPDGTFEDALFDSYRNTSGDAHRSVFGTDAPWARQRGDRVNDLLRTQAGEQIRRIEATDKQRIREILARGIEQGQDPTKIARSLRKEMEGWSKARTMAIATYETNWAWSSGTMEAYKANGVPAKRWLTVGVVACAICSGNEAAGEVWLENEFPSGNQHPPAHPNCRCALLSGGFRGHELVPAYQSPEWLGGPPAGTQAGKTLPKRKTTATPSDIASGVLPHDLQDWTPETKLIPRLTVPDGPVEWSAVENLIRARPQEYAVFLDQANRARVIKSTGQASTISFTAAEVRAVRGLRFTHNHPLGSPFSADDVWFAMGNELAELRACSLAGGESVTYVLLPGAGSAAFDAGAIARAKRTYRRIEKEVIAEIDTLINTGVIKTAAEAGRQHYALLWERFASSMGFRYRREVG